MGTEVLLPQKCVLNSFRFRNRSPSPNPNSRALKKRKDQKDGSPHDPSRNSVPIGTVTISKSGEDFLRKKADEEKAAMAMKELKLKTIQLRKAAARSRRVEYAGHVAPLPPSPRKLPQPGFVRGGGGTMASPSPLIM